MVNKKNRKRLILLSILSFILGLFLVTFELSQIPDSENPWYFLGGLLKGMPSNENERLRIIKKHYWDEDFPYHYSILLIAYKMEKGRVWAQEEINRIFKDAGERQTLNFLRYIGLFEKDVVKSEFVFDSFFRHLHKIKGEKEDSDYRDLRSLFLMKIARGQIVPFSRLSFSDIANKARKAIGEKGSYDVVFSFLTPFLLRSNKLNQKEILFIKSCEKANDPAIRKLCQQILFER